MPDLMTGLVFLAGAAAVWLTPASLFVRIRRSSVIYGVLMIQAIATISLLVAGVLVCFFL